MRTRLLRVQNLRTTFHTRAGAIARAVDDVSFDLVRGETLGLVGESGCGKTVTALSLLRLIDDPPGRIAGESVVEFEGANLLTLPPAGLRKVRGDGIAMVFQDPATSLNPVLTVGTQLVETLRAHRAVTPEDARHRAVELLDLVGIPDAADRVDAYPHQLSGGMQQRVMIAMALSCEPSVLVADEPTTALDVTVQAQLLDLLGSLRERLGMAMLLISHDLAVVAGLADRIAVMYGGQIVETGPTDAIFGSPQHPYTRALIEAAPRLDRPTDRLRAVPGSVPPATRWPSGCRFHPRCPHAWERCRDEAPTPFPVGRGEARCWLIEEPERRRS
jgi:oligopeptide/dipeptide ABC transporter ATP-binding protein